MSRINRPYAVKGAVVTEKLPSVTTVLSMIPKPGLEWGATKETATFAVLHPEKWQHLPPEEAIDVLRRHHRGIWDGRAANGTLAHGVNESFVAGLSVDVEALIEETIENDYNARTWREIDRTDLIESVLGYVLGIEKFWADFTPTDVRSEIVVRIPGVSIGQTDMRCVIDTVWPDGFTGPQDTLLDIKTTAKQDEGSGIYIDSWLYQLAAYGFATEEVTFELVEDKKLRSGYRVVETGTAPWSRPERYCVLHLRGDEDYALYELPVTEAHFETFVHMARAYAGIKSVPTELDLIQPRPVFEGVNA